MGQSASGIQQSYAEYLSAEARSDTRHEYLCGAVVAMAAGTPMHAALAARVIVQLGHFLDGRPCRVFSADLRVRIEDTDLSTYPDVSVVCGELNVSPQDPHAVTNPVLLVEVLSDGTEAYDRWQKFSHYRRMPSLKEYLLVSQREQRLELYRKNEAGHWVLFEAGKVESLLLESVHGAKLETDAVYRDPLAQAGE